ncbi:hypothetical protein BDW22DRAFT_1057193 [Trametopsis cervina]|nr:hypothetical protein BDW22DRAFT_1057193 [Trametopsis cervina]
MSQICDEIYTHGVCHRDNCPFSHDIFTCQVCRSVFETLDKYETHLTTPLHLAWVVKDQRKRAGVAQPVLCTVCDLDISSLSEYALHAQGRKHRANLQRQGLAEDPGPEELDVPRNCTRCDVCGKNIVTSMFDRHIKGESHTQALRFNALQSSIDESEKDKNGVDITPEAIDFGFIAESTDCNAAWASTIHIQNTNVTAITLIEARVSSQLTTRVAHSK